MPDYETANVFLGLYQESQMSIQNAQVRRFRLLSSRQVVQLENAFHDVEGVEERRNWTHYVALVCGMTVVVFH